MKKMGSYYNNDCNNNDGDGNDGNKIGKEGRQKGLDFDPRTL